MITRSINTYKAEAIEVKRDGMSANVEVIATVEFQGTHATKTLARKAFAAAGMPVPKGVDIEITTVGSVTYGCTFEEFMAIAKPVSDNGGE